MDLKALDISMSRCSLLDSCSAKRHNNKLHKMEFLLKMLDLILHKLDFLLRMTVFLLRMTGFTLSRKILRLVVPVPDAQ